MNSEFSSQLLNVRPLTIARNLTSISSTSPTLSIDCDDLYGAPLLPASDIYQCGTKTSNETLMSICCNDTEVKQYLGCFMYCHMQDFSGSRMQDFVACLSSNNSSSTAPANATRVDPNVFCQAELQGEVNATTSGIARRCCASSSSFSFLLSIALIVLLLFDAAIADCSVATTDSPDFAMIRQAESREFGAGVSCSGRSQRPFCVFGHMGPPKMEAFNRTIDGKDASDASYDDFFELLGNTVEPPRLFPATSSVRVSHWVVGAADSELVNYSLWAPFIYCVRVVANNCFDDDKDDVILEACGPLFQSGTGLGDDDPIIQGVFMKGSRAVSFS